MPAERHIDENHIVIVAAAEEAAAGIGTAFSIHGLAPVLARAGMTVMMALGLGMTTPSVIMVGSRPRVKVEAASGISGMPRTVFVPVHMGTSRGLQQELERKHGGDEQTQGHVERLPAALPERQSQHEELAAVPPHKEILTKSAAIQQPLANATGMA
jgi:hypothetical protein